MSTPSAQDAIQDKKTAEEATSNIGAEEALLNVESTPAAATPFTISDGTSSGVDTKHVQEQKAASNTTSGSPTSPVTAPPTASATTTLGAPTAATTIPTADGDSVSAGGRATICICYCDTYNDSL